MDRDRERDKWIEREIEKEIEGDREIDGQRYIYRERNREKEVNRLDRRARVKRDKGQRERERRDTLNPPSRYNVSPTTSSTLARVNPANYFI